MDSQRRVETPPPQYTQQSTAPRDAFVVDVGQSVSHAARFVALWWHAHAIPERHEVDFGAELLNIVPSGSGVYAATGRHDTKPGGGVLYIGMASDLATRVPTSIAETLGEKHANGDIMLFSDVWDLTVRWAEVSEQVRASVERILIMSHSPPFNGQWVRRQFATKEEHDLVVMNAGRKGPLLPIVAGAYQAAGWDNHGQPLRVRSVDP